MKPSHMSTNPENLVKIGPEDSDITRQEVGPLKLIKKTHKQNTARGAGMSN